MSVWFPHTLRGLANGPRCECESERLGVVPCWPCDELGTHPGCTLPESLLLFKVPDAYPTW